MKSSNGEQQEPGLASISAAGTPRAFRLTKLGYVLGLGALALVVLGSFIRTGIDGYPSAMLTDQIHGSVSRPFAYRALVPLVVRAISAGLPETVKATITEAIHGFSGQRVFEKIVSFGDPVDFVIAASIWYASILAFGWAMIHLARALYQGSVGSFRLLSLIAVAGLPTMFMFYSYLYDLTHLFLFTLCLALLARARWGAFLIVFTLATLSKETAILLTLLFGLAYYSTLPRPLFKRLLVTQLGLYVLIRSAVYFAFRDNPGNLVEWHLAHNLSLHSYALPQFLAYLTLGMAVMFDWRNKPAFICDGLWMLVSLVGLAMFFGIVDEFRGYYEVYPIIALHVAHTIARLLRVPSFEPIPRLADGHSP